MRPATIGFGDLEVDDGRLLIVPEHAIGAGFPVHCPVRAFTEGPSVVVGTFRRGTARG